MKIQVACLFIATAVLSGCGQESNDKVSAKAPPQPESNAPRAPTKESIYENLKKQGSAPSSSTTIALTPSELNVALERYTSLDSEPMALTYLIIAFDPTPISEEEKLGRLSPAWYSTSDAFKKQELAKSELPRVESKLNEYRKQHCYIVPISNSIDHEIAVPRVSLDTYDLTNKRFPLGNFGAHCWNGLYRNSQQAQLEIKGDIVPCRLSVSDENVARSIEAARAAGRLQTSGSLYIYVERAQNGTANGVVTAARLSLTDTRTNTPLGVFEIRPQQ